MDEMVESLKPEHWQEPEDENDIDIHLEAVILNELGTLVQVENGLFCVSAGSVTEVDRRLLSYQVPLE